MAKIETLVDDFSAGSINGTTWPTVASGVVLTGGHIQITDSSGSYPSIISATTYDGTSSYVFAQIGAATVTGGGTGPQQTYFGYYKDGSNSVGLAMGDTHLYWYKTVAGAETDTAIGTYNATSMAWWRVRDDGVGLYFGYSADGVSWTETARQTRPFTLTSVGVYFSVGRYAAGTNPVGTMDNVNTTGSVSKSDSDTGSGADSSGTVKQLFTGTETGSGAEAVSTRTITDTETSTGADSAGTNKVTGTETGTGTDVEATRTIQGTETGTGTDSAGTPKLLGTETGTGTEAEASRSLTDTETGSGTDSAGTVKLSSTDTGTGTESAGGVTQTNNLSDSDTGTGTDSAGTVKLSGTETGTGTEAEASRTVQSTDTGSGADSAGTVKLSSTDTGTGTDSAGSQSYTATGTETGTGTDAVSTRKLAGTETVAGADAGNLAGNVAKFGSDTASGTEAQTRYMPGSFSQIPVPKTWSNGDSLDHGTLNKEWRDTFNWLLRATSPAFSGYNGDAASLTYTNQSPIPIKTEELKRGNLVHAANDSKVYVYEPGWYMGFAQCGANYTSVTADGLKPAVIILVNGTIAARSQTTKTSTGQTLAATAIQFSLYLNAGDYVEMALGNDWTGTLIGYANAYAYPFLELWWRTN